MGLGRLSMLGLDHPVSIMSLVPMLLFAVLFGLSMDYEVFLLAAIHENQGRTRTGGDESARAPRLVTISRPRIT